MLCYHAMAVEDGRWKPTVYIIKGYGLIQGGFPDGEFVTLWQADEDWTDHTDAKAEAKRKAEEIEAYLENDDLVFSLNEEIKEFEKEIEQLKLYLRTHLELSIHDGHDVWNCVGTTACDCLERRRILTEIAK